MLLYDDAERDYGDLETAASFAETSREPGFNAVSLRDEFETIFKTDAVKAALDNILKDFQLKESRSKEKLQPNNTMKMVITT